MIRKGQYPDVKEKPPFTPGYDLVGEVDKIGLEVNGLHPGQLVADLTVIGAHSEYVCLPAENLISVPDSLDPAEAVSLVLSYVTAYQMLHRAAGIKPCQRILVHGAAGGVGTALLQLGRLLDLEIYGTDSRSKHDLITNLGGVPIDYQTQDFVEVVSEQTENGVDAVFDHIGGKHYQRSFQSLSPGGKLIAYGFYNATLGKGGSVPLDFIKLHLWNMLPYSRQAKLYSIGSWRKKHPDWFREDLKQLFHLLQEDKIRPEIWKRISLKELDQAHIWIEEAASTGKIVIEMDH
jgi:NADPH:quinone reductase-like Zn-dependent oxidoreductase